MSDKTPNSPEDAVDPSLDPGRPASEGETAEADLLASAKNSESDDVTAEDEVDADLRASIDELDDSAAEEVESTHEPVARKTSKAPVKKSAPTSKRSEKRDGPSEDGGRVGPVTFTKQSIGELKKVNWPTGSQLGQYFAAVLIFVLFAIAFVGLLDLGFSAGLLALFG